MGALLIPVLGILVPGILMLEALFTYVVDSLNRRSFCSGALLRSPATLWFLVPLGTLYIAEPHAKLWWRVRTLAARRCTLCLCQPRWLLHRVGDVSGSVRKQVESLVRILRDKDGVLGCDH